MSEAQLPEGGESLGGGSVAECHYNRLAEFFAFPGWNKVVEYVHGTVIHIAVTRESDGARHWVHTDTANGTLGPMAMFALMANMAIGKMKACDSASCPKHCPR